MKFPYGICDFHKIITEDYFYIDRTSYIPALEEAGSQLLFLRPRRFGKSLVLSMLENYYDVARADEFARLFGHLAIGQHPTARHNQYFILKWDFSLVDPQGDVAEIKQALHNHLNDRIKAFASHYQDLLSYRVEINSQDAISSFESALTAVSQTSHSLYLLIDEYDNFANEVLMSGRATSKARYEELLYGEGTLKTVFKAVKAAAAGRGLDRAFITGVSPVVLSDITSGYNVAKNIYLKPQFNDLCGFRETEIRDTLQRVGAACAFPPAQIDETLSTMRAFYNGYRFAPNATEWVYNPTLALYFIENLQESCQYPRKMLDSNLAMDRGKISYISDLPGGQQVLQDALDETAPLIINELADRFGVADMLELPKDYAFMASLLYYFGVLTLQGATIYNELELIIPNSVVRKLYLERMQESLLPGFADQDAARRAARQFYRTGDLQPLCDFMEQRYFKVLDNRDYRWTNELTIKIAFLTLLFNDLLYIMDSETTAGRGYADLTMIVRPDMRRQQLADFLLEFKYVSLADVQLSHTEVQKMSAAELRALAPVTQKLTEARTNLAEYRAALENKYGAALQLRTYGVAAVGLERVIWEEVQPYN